MQSQDKSLDVNRSRSLGGSVLKRPDLRYGRVEAFQEREEKSQAGSDESKWRILIGCASTTRNKHP